MTQFARAGLAFLVAASLVACTTVPSVDAPKNNPQAASSPVTNQDFASIKVPELAALMGQDTAYLTDLLGAPTLRRKESGMELWQYAGPTCVLLFYLYEDGNEALAIEHLEARSRAAGAQPVDQTGCLKEAVGTKGARTVS